MSNSVVLLLPATLGQGCEYFLSTSAKISDAVLHCKGQPGYSQDIGNCSVRCITAAEKKKRKEYTDRHHDRSLCTKRQPEMLQSLALTMRHNLLPTLYCNILLCKGHV